MDLEASIVLLQGLHIAILENLHTTTNIQSCFLRVVSNPLIKSMDMDLQGLEGIVLDEFWSIYNFVVGIKYCHF